MGMNPSDLRQTAQSPIRLNRTHPEDDFPRAHPRSEAADDLLLYGDFDGG